MLLYLMIIFTFINLNFVKNDHLSIALFGKRESCSNEGEEVKVDKLTGLACFSCICKNGFVECNQEKCPSVEGCYQLLPKSKDTCCTKCKGCVYKGYEYASNSEWTDEEDPCIIYRCEASVITKSKLECYTPCQNPLLPQPGQCCPTCPACQINGQKLNNDLDITLLEDPCLKCECDVNKGHMECVKKACPVLQCPLNNQIARNGECCPVCKESRVALVHVQDTCVLNRKLLKIGEMHQLDKCSRCECLNNGTTICERPVCPVLECLPQYQVHSDTNCCPHCLHVEENRTTCFSNGNNYQNGESWQLNECKACMCHHGEIRCAVVRCSTDELCPSGHKLVHLPGKCCPECVESDSVCTVFGDPHYKTFDGKFYSFQGSCKYELVSDCVDHTFSIRVTNDARKTKSSAWTKTISIKTKDVKINLGQKKRIKINGEKINKLPYNSSDRFKLETLNEGFISIETYLGIKIIWDGMSFLEVSAPQRYKGHLCGLCGNYNSNVKDDLRLRSGEIIRDDKDIWKFATSWRVGGRKACARQKENLKKNSKSCIHQIRYLREVCKPLIDNKTKYFDSCDKKLSPNKYYRSCMMDMCECPTGRCFCEAFTAYAHECQRLGVQISNWRQLTNCHINSNSYNSYEYNSTFEMPLNLLKLQNKKSHKKQVKEFDHLIFERQKMYSKLKRGPPPPLI